MENEQNDEIRKIPFIIDKLFENNKKSSIKLYENILNSSSISEKLPSSEWLLSKQNLSKAYHNLEYFNPQNEEFQIQDKDKAMFKVKY